MQRRLFSNVQAYVGQTRSQALVTRLAAAGIGECVVRGELPPRRHRWFYDNGAYTDFVNNRPFDYLQYSRDLRAIRMWREAGWIGRGKLEGQTMTAPDFVVLPDLVGQGDASMGFSLNFLYESREAGVPLYLAVQDGMSLERVKRFIELYAIDGIFVGGTLTWKLETAEAWCALGRRLGIPVHIGRVGTLDRVAWAQEIGATSIDSAFPLWSVERLEAFIEAVA